MLQEPENYESCQTNRGEREEQRLEFFYQFLLCIILFTWPLFMEKHMSFQRISITPCRWPCRRIVTLQLCHNHVEELWLFVTMSKSYTTLPYHVEGLWLFVTMSKSCDSSTFGTHSTVLHFDFGPCHFRQCHIRPCRLCSCQFRL